MLPCTPIAENCLLNNWHTFFSVTKEKTQTNISEMNKEKRQVGHYTKLLAGFNEDIQEKMNKFGQCLDESYARLADIKTAGRFKVQPPIPTLSAFPVLPSSSSVANFTPIQLGEKHASLSAGSTKTKKEKQTYPSGEEKMKKRKKDKEEDSG